jgi:hypothetical protein
MPSEVMGLMEATSVKPIQGAVLCFRESSLRDPLLPQLRFHELCFNPDYMRERRRWGSKVDSLHLLGDLKIHLTIHLLQPPPSVFTCDQVSLAARQHHHIHIIGLRRNAHTKSNTQSLLVPFSVHSFPFDPPIPLCPYIRC